jgi:hypothetical protein
MWFSIAMCSVSLSMITKLLGELFPFRRKGRAFPNPQKALR